MAKRTDLEKWGYENAEPGDNSRYLRHALASWDMPPIDISDGEQVKLRVADYFKYCIENDRKPNIVGMANWLGVDRTTIHSWKIGKYRASTHHDTIKKAVDIMEELWVDYMMNGKVNPASGIFIGKNLFHYRDSQDLVVTPNNPMGDYQTQKALEAKLADVVVDEDEC